VSGPPARAEEKARLALGELTGLSIEELMHVRVNSAAKKDQDLRETPAAAFVITADDIRRSGATTVPQLLRQVPGMEVAQLSSGRWSVGSRGFNGIYANKLLVLMDGRSIYTPLFSGVYWEMLSPPLGDIDRIEVIRGPGGTIWGANAVNGVVNIITKKASDTRGTRLSAGYGGHEQFFTSLRHGGEAGKNSDIRAWLRRVGPEESVLPGGGDAHDGYNLTSGGFRFDGRPSDRDRLTATADFFEGGLSEILFRPSPPVGPGGPFATPTDTPTRMSGGSAMVRLDRTYSQDSDAQLQLYFDGMNRNSPIVNTSVQTLDLSFHRRQRLDRANELLWGFEVRATADDNRQTTDILVLHPAARTTHMFSVFAQDEFRFAQDELRLIVGSKLERNPFTGWEVQPTARLLWVPDGRHSAWLAYSRVVRTPSRIEREGELNVGAMWLGAAGPALVRVYGRPEQSSESLEAMEAGLRLEASPRLSFDLAAYHNWYENLRSFEPGLRNPFPEASPLPAHLVVPLEVKNGVEGRTWGLELAADWQAARDWKLRGGWNWLETRIHGGAGSRDTIGQAEADHPAHQLFLRSQLDLAQDLEFDATVRRVASLEVASIPAYTSLDLRLGWRPARNLEFSLVGQNLLDGSHPEAETRFIAIERTEVERCAYGKLTWTF
jgi:iron complex outermembrane receptor protein